MAKNILSRREVTWSNLNLRLLERQPLYNKFTFNALASNFPTSVRKIYIITWCGTHVFHTGKNIKLRNPSTMKVYQKKMQKIWWYSWVWVLKTNDPECLSSPINVKCIVSQTVPVFVVFIDLRNTNTTNISCHANVKWPVSSILLQIELRTLFRSIIHF